MENSSINGWWLGVPLFQETTRRRFVAWSPKNNYVQKNNECIKAKRKMESDGDRSWNYPCDMWTTFDILFSTSQQHFGQWRALSWL